jgi:hypothetical protein
MKLTAEELNALLQITANAPISGKDAKFVSALMDKLAAMLEAEKNPVEVE